MTPPNKVPNLTKLQYPVYVQPIVTDYSLLYNPLEAKLTSIGAKALPNEPKALLAHFKALKGVKDCVVMGYLRENPLKFVLYDCLPLKTWAAKEEDKDLTYSKRLKGLRQLLNDQVADYKNIIDIGTDLVYTPRELKESYRVALEAGFKGVIIRNPEGIYKFTEVTFKDNILYKLESSNK